MPVLQIRLTDDEHSRLNDAAKVEGVPIAAFARGILFPSPDVKDIRGEGGPALAVVPRPGFKRSPKCESAKCHRLQRATCDPCRQANAKGF